MTTTTRSVPPSQDGPEAMVRPALVVFAAMTILTGVIYPLFIWGVAQACFPRQANGSLIARDGAPVDTEKSAIGSSLIGQEFTDAKYLWGRVSATSPVPYTSFNADKAAGSSGSNLGPTNPAFLDGVKGRLDALKAADAAAGYARPADQPVPVDLVTASASGLDPHISPAAAEYQVPRIARVRGLSEASVRGVVQRETSRRQWGVLGEPVVHVLKVNLSLDAVSPPASGVR